MPLAHNWNSLELKRGLNDRCSHLKQPLKISEKAFKPIVTMLLTAGGVEQEGEAIDNVGVQVLMAYNRGKKKCSALMV